MCDHFAVAFRRGERGRDGVAHETGGQPEDGAADAAALVRPAFRRTGRTAVAAQRAALDGRTDGPLRPAQRLHRLHQGPHEQLGTRC